MRDHLKKNKLTYPNLIDNDFAYWNKLNNRYWPTIYLIDKKGQIRYVHIGETHSGTPEALQVEAWIEGLLSEEAG